LLIKLFRVASSSLRLRSRNRLTGEDEFFATIRASAWLSFASAVSRSGDVNLLAASRLAVRLIAFCWVVIRIALMPHMYRELKFLDPQHKTEFSQSETKNRLRVLLPSVRDEASYI
jgi:hypothetical protein